MKTIAPAALLVLALASVSEAAPARGTANHAGRGTSYGHSNYNGRLTYGFARSYGYDYAPQSYYYAAPPVVVEQPPVTFAPAAPVVVQQAAPVIVQQPAYAPAVQIYAAPVYAVPTYYAPAYSYGYGYGVRSYAFRGGYGGGRRR